MAFKNRFYNSDFHRVFNFKTEETKGRSVILLNSLLANIANAFITGALYTAFLAENGIDIVRVGIISFIPYISWALSVFSPMLLAKIRRRQRMMLCVDFVYYISLIVATTIMPLFVEDPLKKRYGLPCSRLFRTPLMRCWAPVIPHGCCGLFRRGVI